MIVGGVLSLLLMAGLCQGFFHYPSPHRNIARRRYGRPCGEFYPSGIGKITLPDYLKDYPSATNCTWTIGAPGQLGAVYFKDFQPENKKLNHVQIRSDSWHGRVVDLAARRKRNFTFTGRAYIHFTSDLIHSNQRLVIYYKITKMPHNMNDI